MKNTLPLLVLFLALVGCDRQNDPAPAAGVVTINLSNTSPLLSVSASACLRETPMRAPETGKVLWTDQLTNTKVVVGPVARGTRLYLSIQYNNVLRPGYWWPAQGEAIEAELLVDGKKVKGVLLNANSFNDPANYFPAGENRTNLVQEVEVIM